MQPARPTLLRTLSLLVATVPAAAQGIGGGIIVEDEATQIDQRLGAAIDRNAAFVDENGDKVTIGDYLGQGKPVILNLQYFSCPTLCGPVMRGLVSALEIVEPSVGKDMTVLSVSFDHREKTDLAAHKKTNTMLAYTRDGAAEGWHFLTGDRENIMKLTESVGYGFRWNNTREDFDHRAVIILISPSGTITRYLSDNNYNASTLRLAVVEASEGTVGSAMDRFLLSCYSYDPRTGTYSRIGPIAMATGGALTIAALAILLFVLFRRERQQRRDMATAAAS